MVEACPYAGTSLLTVYSKKTLESPELCELSSPVTEAKDGGLNGVVRLIQK